MNIGYAQYKLEDYYGFHNNSLGVMINEVKNNQSNYAHSSNPLGDIFRFYIEYSNENFSSDWTNSEKEEFMQRFNQFDFKDT